jgi:two-component system invasion response regulator UvrY
MNTSMESGVLIINENPIILAGLKELFKSRLQNAQVEGFNSLDAYIASGQTPKKLMLLCDTPTQQSSFPAFISGCRKSGDCPAIIVHSASSNFTTAISYLSAGASGYISRLNNIDMLFNCVETVLKGEKYICQPVIENMIQGLSEDTKSKGVLTEREKEIAQLLCQGEKTMKIAKELNLQPSTVSTFKARLFRKVNVNSSIELAGLLKTNPEYFLS